MKLARSTSWSAWGAAAYADTEESIAKLWEIDGMTDAFRRFRTVDQIRHVLEALGATQIEVWAGGNGVEAWCRKPEAAGPA